MLVMYWSTYQTQVPLYLSSNKVWRALEGLLPEQSFRFIDLGSGLVRRIDTSGPHTPGWTLLRHRISPAAATMELAAQPAFTQL